MSHLINLKRDLSNTKTQELIQIKEDLELHRAGYEKEPECSANDYKLSLYKLSEIFEESGNDDTRYLELSYWQDAIRLTKKAPKSFTEEEFSLFLTARLQSSWLLRQCKRYAEAMLELDKADQSLKATENGNQAEWYFMKACCEMLYAATFLEMKDLGAAKVALQAAEELIQSHALEGFNDCLNRLREDIAKADSWNPFVKKYQPDFELILTG